MLNLTRRAYVTDHYGNTFPPGLFIKNPILELAQYNKFCCDFDLADTVYSKNVKTPCGSFCLHLPEDSEVTF